MKKEISTKAFDPIIDKVEKLTKIQRILICAVSLVLIVGIFIYFGYLPKQKTIEYLSKDYAKLQKEIDTAKRQAKNLTKFKAEYEKAQADLKIVQERLPKKNEIPKLLANISQSGHDSGLEFLLFKPEPEIVKGFFAEIPVSIEVLGTYHQVAMFFDRISRLERVVNIKNIKILVSNSKDSASKLKTTCTAVTYKFLENAKVDESKTKSTKKK